MPSLSLRETTMKHNSG
uniref:Uncharacterized protein n=1 Tax=Arundo donax TaxID=35708 RepID=A0A0A8Z1G1_ARUDO